MTNFWRISVAQRSARVYGVTLLGRFDLSPRPGEDTVRSGGPSGSDEAAVDIDDGAVDALVHIPLSGDIAYQSGFNANGIARTPDGKALLVVQSNTELEAVGEGVQVGQVGGKRLPPLAIGHRPADA
ncbi:hypothetical protein [Streptomyces sp. NBC_01314]|uniref:hypothetical protein n=1 Tax=Streptomyces sp. NBC_01314 TaxID=2903821 RepID=UPI00308E4745|nr:hypothetical protein OG622_48820 [Streptomyces sp. NBC_01314]